MVQHDLRYGLIARRITGQLPKCSNVLQVNATLPGATIVSAVAGKVILPQWIFIQGVTAVSNEVKYTLAWGAPASTEYNKMPIFKRSITMSPTLSTSAYMENLYSEYPTKDLTAFINTVLNFGVASNPNTTTLATVGYFEVDPTDWYNDAP